MTRKPGSGLNKELSKSIEVLTARLFEGRPTADAMDRIRRQKEAGRTEVSATSIHRWVATIVDQLELPVVKADLPPTDYLGDVQLTLEDGSFAYVEVKAQTTKSFTELTQADWIKGVTDTLRHLFAEDEAFRAAQPRWLAELMQEESADRYFGLWRLSDLWVADVALLTDRNRRRIAGVDQPSDLANFLSRKYLLHISAQGARAVRLDRLPLVRAVLEGHQIDWRIRILAKSTAVDIGHDLETRGRDFAYYVGYSEKVIGRHKLVGRALEGADGIIEVR